MATPSIFESTARISRAFGAIGQTAHGKRVCDEILGDESPYAEATAAAIAAVVEADLAGLAPTEW